MFSRLKKVLSRFTGRLSLAQYEKEREHVFAWASGGGVVMFVIYKLCIRSTLLVLHPTLLSLAWAAFIASMIYELYIIMWAISLSIGRLHDVGKKGAWVLYPLFYLIRNIYLHLDECGEPGENCWGQNPEEHETETAPEPLPADLAPLLSGSSPDPVELYRQAVENSDAMAGFKLGLCYFYGLGVASNKMLAFYWVHRSARKNLSEASEFLHRLQYQ